MASKALKDGRKAYATDVRRDFVTALTEEFAGRLIEAGLASGFLITRKDGVVEVSITVD